MINLYFDLETGKGDIEFKINNFPDGQRSITILPDEVSKFYQAVHVVIIKSITNFKDLELVLSAVSAISAHTYNFSLYSPYIVGARSDRKFEVGGDMYFDDVILPILEGCGFQTIYTFDNHCGREILTDISLWELSKFYITDRNFGMLYPDKSAGLRFSRFDDVESSTYMNKIRKDGKVIQEVNDPTVLESLLDEERIIIFDDLFDGGASYINLCEKLRNEYYFKGKITIFVTHFIASNEDNLHRLEKLGVSIVTSNSYTPKFEYKDIEVIDLFDTNLLNKLI